MHHRKPSKDDEDTENTVQMTSEPPPPPTILPAPPPKNRVHSGPGVVASDSMQSSTSTSSLSSTSSASLSSSSSHTSTSSHHTRSPSLSLNSVYSTPISPRAQSFGHPHNLRPPFLNAHSRARSVSGPYVPSISSPLATSFDRPPVPPLPPRAQPQAQVPIPMFSFPTLDPSPVSTTPDASPFGQGPPQPALPAGPPAHSRRHSRLHSRNLSIFFPRPHATINEDEKLPDEEAPALPPPEPLLIPSSHSEPIVGAQNGHGRAPVKAQLAPSFTFGKGSPTVANGGAGAEPGGLGLGVPPTSTTSKRRGHHHKHSLSHNFFSFLEPGSTATPSLRNGSPPERPREDLHTAPTPTPTSPWTPISNASLLSTPNNSGVDPPLPRATPSPSPEIGGERVSSVPPTSSVAALAAVGQFALGALLWARGQQLGSLSVTGLGYWVVFDAFGVGIPALVARGARVRRSYASARLPTLLSFAQCCYLMFASVYVCKETVEHVLLSAGDDGSAPEGHHHHHGDENPDFGVPFPILQLLLTVITLLSTSLMFGHHESLAGATNTRIPLSLRSDARIPPRTALLRTLTNPYALPPIAFCSALLLGSLYLDSHHHFILDLALAGVETVVTFNVAYRASVVLGAVLLQTSPAPARVKGHDVGRLDSFWRVVKEIEHHEHVVHLPSPHIWQLAAPGQAPVEIPASDDKVRPGMRTKKDSNIGHEHHHHHHHHHGHDHDHVHANGHSRLPSLTHSHSTDSYFLQNGDAHEHTHDSTHAQGHDHHGANDSNGIHRWRSPGPGGQGQIHVPAPNLVITLAPHVKKELGDADVLALTRWASERVRKTFALGSVAALALGFAGGVEVEVTVGVVRE